MSSVAIDIEKYLRVPYEQKYYNPLINPPKDWPADGRFFPLGPNSKVKGDWHVFWQQVAIQKKLVAATAKLPAPRGQPRTAAETVQNVKDNLGTHVLATVYCPLWAQSWAFMLLSLIAKNVATTEDLTCLALKGGPASDEECAFMRILMLELGFEEKGYIHYEQNPNYSLMARWSLARTDATDLQVSLKQYLNIGSVGKFLDVDFAPNKRATYEPFLQRVAVVSCAEMWFLDGKTMRINPEEKDENHTEGMTVNDKVNSILVKALNHAKDRASEKGFAPMKADGDGAVPWLMNENQTEEERLTACAYYDVSPRR